ncbi:uncharacterized protein HKW66_Vig0230780 [Vigna angularis]|uniref:Uncharacterized protein n=1 Tax=Phaseolus angularis TaxID=3914 RepID=A0A8T0KE90_PHAAN|nr:uncharacterized protein HKW66_Vig0230780 [Vigna angularis]
MESSDNPRRCLKSLEILAKSVDPKKGHRELDRELGKLSRVGDQLKQLVRDPSSNMYKDELVTQRLELARSILQQRIDKEIRGNAKCISDACNLNKKCFFFHENQAQARGGKVWGSHHPLTPETLNPLAFPFHHHLPSSLATTFAVVSLAPPTSNLAPGTSCHHLQGRTQLLHPLVVSLHTLLDHHESRRQLMFLYWP